MNGNRKLVVLTLFAILAIIAVACAAPPTSAPTAAPPTAAAKPAAGPLDALAAACKTEHGLTTIALDPTWLNDRAVLDGFMKKYGIKINELDPLAGSGDEINAIKANKDNKGPQAPDVIEVGFSFGDSAKAEGLLQPYKVQNWASIPDSAKDPAGYWYGLYYGAMAFEVNTSVVKNVPQDWSDLLKPEYKGQVALSGDPRSSNQAIQAVEAAALGNGGTLDDATAGLNFFKKLSDAGNFVPVIAKEGTLAKGETPIALGWDYLGLGYKADLKGNPPITVVVPKTGVFGGVYVDAISAYAPHPNCAKLFMEWRFSDEALLLKADGYGHPINFADMVKRGVIPQSIQDKLPPASLYDKIVFPSPKQLADAKTLITTKWDSVVNVNVK